MLSNNLKSISTLAALLVLAGWAMVSVAWCEEEAPKDPAPTAPATPSSPEVKGKEGKGADLYYLEVEVKEPRPVTVQTPKGEEVYWYFTYTVKNPTTKKVYFCPKLRLLTENGDVYSDSIYT